MTVADYNRGKWPAIKVFFRENWIYIIILLAALGLRLFVLITEGHKMYLGTDDNNYRKTAEILLQTGILKYGGYKGATVFIMPGYPLFLAAIFAVVGKTSWFAARLVQVILSLFLVVFSARLGERIGGKWTGIVTAFIMAIYPPNLTAPSFLLTELLFTIFLLAALVTFARAEEKWSLKWFIITGVMLGLATYIRPTSGLLPVVLGGYIFMRRYDLKKAVYVTAVTFAALYILLSPWIIRNYVQFKEFVPFTISGGNPFLRGTYLNDKIYEKFPWVDNDDNRIKSDRAQMAYGKKRLINGLKTNFGAYLKWYTVGKFSDFWGYPYYYRVLSRLPKEDVNIFHWIILAAGSGGIILGLKRRKSLILLFLLICAYFAFTHMVYLTGPRYSYPVMPLVIIPAAYFITSMISLVREKLISH